MNAPKFIPVYTRQFCVANGRTGVVARFTRDQDATVYFPADGTFATLDRSDLVLAYHNGRPNIARDVKIPGVTRTVRSYVVKTGSDLYPTKICVVVDQATREAFFHGYSNCGMHLHPSTRARAAAAIRENRNGGMMEVYSHVLDGPGISFGWVEPRRKAVKMAK
jgi:hypothetical protein